MTADIFQTEIKTFFINSFAKKDLEKATAVLEDKICHRESGKDFLEDLCDVSSYDEIALELAT